MKHGFIRSLVILLFLASPAAVLAHGDAVVELGSSASGSGALAADYDFSAVSKLSFSLSGGGISLYTGIFPAFEPLTADAAPFYALATGTQASIQITDNDGGKTAVKFDTTVLSHIGDSAVIGTIPFDHTHPEYQLQLQLPEGEFGEGRISFKLTASGPTTYADSPVYTIKISNGPLPLIDFDTDAYDKGAVKCLSKAAKSIAKFVAVEQTVLGKCLDKVQAADAKAALTTPPSSLAAAQAAAEKACADASGSGPDASTMLGRLDAARAKALADIQGACGVSGSGSYADDDITQMLGLASCRAQELVAGTYGVAHEQLEEITVRPSQGGDSVAAHLPCLYLTASD